MSERNYDETRKAKMDEMLLVMPGVKASKAFGYPAYKVNDKLAVGLFENGIVAKVGPKRVKELVGQNGIQSFEPMAGRVWKDWVLLTGNFEQNKALLKKLSNMYLRKQAHERTQL